MTAVHKIMGDFYEDPFDLVAVHSSLEDYELVYFINLHLKSRLRRCKKDVELSSQIPFPIFEWRDEPNEVFWSLVTNKSFSESSTPRTELFQEELAYTAHHLIPERKEVDFFLKIEQAHCNIETNVVKPLLSIPKVVTAYQVDVANLKSKPNIIFI